MSTHAALTKGKQSQQLAELRGALKSPYMPWNTIVDLVLNHAGLPLTISIATDPNYKIPDDSSSLAKDLGHTILQDFIIKPADSNGLGMSWKAWTDHVKATILAERYAIRAQDISVKQLIHNDREVTEHLGRYAGTASEWHATRVKIEQLEYRTMASRISAQAREHRKMGRKILEKYSEAASALSKSQKKIEQLNSHLEITEQSLVSSQQRHKQDIEKFEQDAVKNLYQFNTERESLNDEIRSLTHTQTYLQKQVQLHSEERLDLLKKISDLKSHSAEFDNLTNNLFENEKQLAETLSENIDLSDINAKLKNDIEDASLLHSEQSKKIQNLEESVRSQTIINKSLRESLRTSKESICELENKLSDVRSLLNNQPVAVEKERQLREQLQEQARLANEELLETQRQLVASQEKLSFVEQLLIEDDGIFVSAEKKLFFQELQSLEEKLSIEKSDHAYTAAALKTAITECDAKDNSIRAYHKRIAVYNSIIHDLKNKLAAQKALVGVDLSNLIDIQKNEISALENRKGKLEAEIIEYQQRIAKLKNIIQKAMVKLSRVNTVLKQRRRYIRSANNFIRIQTKSIEINWSRSKTRDLRMLALSIMLLASVGLLTFNSGYVNLEPILEWKKQHNNEASEE